MKKIIFLTLILAIGCNNSTVYGESGIVVFGEDGDKVGDRVELKVNGIAKIIDSQITQLVDQLREERAHGVKMPKESLDKIFGSRGDENVDNLSIERGKRTVYQYFMWKIFEKIADKQNIAIPQFVDFFEVGPQKSEVEALQNSAQMTKVVNSIKKLKIDNINIEELKKFFNDINGERVGIQDFEANLKSSNSLILALSHNVKRFFKSQNFKNDMVNIAMIVFYKAIAKYKKNLQNDMEKLKLSDIFDIMMYIKHKLHQFNQFDDDINIKVTDEIKINDDFGLSFAFYRKNRLLNGDDKALEYQQKKLQLTKNNNFTKNDRKFRESKRLSFFVSKIFNNTLKGDKKGEDFYTAISRKNFKDITLKDLIKNINKDYGFKKHNSSDGTLTIKGLLYALYKKVFEQLEDNESISEPVCYMAANIFLECIFKHSSIRKNIKNIQNLKISDILTFVEFITKKADQFTDQYATAYHEGAHAFITNSHDIGLNLATIIQNGDVLGAVWRDPGANNWQNICISSAGILGDFLILKKFLPVNAESDFQKCFNNAKALCEKVGQYRQQNPKDQDASKTGDAKIEAERIRKLEKYMVEGVTMLKNCEELGRPSLNKFLTKELQAEIRGAAADENNIRGLIAAAIYETFLVLTKEEGKKEKSYKAFAEKLFDSGVFDRGDIEKYLSHDFGIEDLTKTDAPVRRAPGAKIEPKYIQDKKTSILNNNLNIIPIDTISSKEIELALLKVGA